MENSIDKPTILVVDDEHLMINMLGGLLQEDYRVLVATNGEDALARAQGEQKPNLILLDVVMPEMDGYEICERLKAIEETREIPVMFLTAKSDPQEETRGLDLGAVDYITKPITPSIVMARIERHLRLQKLQHELQLKNTALEKEIQKRKAMEKALIAARDKEQLANKIKSSFVAHVSHEIRTPLNCVIGMLQLATDSSTTAQQNKYISKAQKSAKSMTAIINDLLDLSKIAAGKLDINLADTSLPGLMADVIDLLKVPALEKNLNLNLSIDEKTPQMVKADGQRISQILINLGYNAVKFTQSGSVEIQLGHCLSDSGQTQLKFTIKDTGIGIPAAQQADLFKPYTQLEHHKYGGTGLGLAICKNLVKLMGGEIWLESQKGQGSSFYFTLPLKPSTTTTSTVTPAATIQQSQTSIKSRILLVDDTPLNLEAIATQLRQEGIDITATNSGQQALTILDNERFDAVLLDIHMPQLNGYETARKIRQKPNCEHLPILALTGDLLTTTHQKIADSGMNGLVSKPIDKTVVLAELKQWISIPTQPNIPAIESEKTPAKKQPSSLLGFDTQQGLARAEQDENRYRKYLKMFNESIAQNIEALSAASENQDNESINKIIHGLRGVTPIVCATAIELALDAVLQAQENQTGTQATLNSLIVEMKRSYIALCRYFENDHQEAKVLSNEDTQIVNTKKHSQHA